LRKISKKVVIIDVYITYSYFVETFLRKISKKVVGVLCFYNLQLSLETFLRKISKKVVGVLCFTIVVDVSGDFFAKNTQLVGRKLNCS